MEGRPSIAHICRGVQHGVLTTDYGLLDHRLQDNETTGPTTTGLSPENLRHQGQEAPAIAFPTLQHLEPAVYSRALFGWQLLDHLRNPFEPRLAIVQMRDNLIAEKARDQITQLGDCFIMHAALPRHIYHSHGADIAKEFEPLARRTLAELQTLDQVVHSQRTPGNEEQPIDLSQ